MMVRINFLPKTYQPPKQLGPKEWAMAAGVAVAVVSTSVFYMTAFAGASRMETQVKADQARHQQVKADLSRAAELKAREEQVARAKADLKSLEGRDWSPVLLSLRDLTPQHVTWGSVKIEGDSITLKATSRGLVDVAQLFGGLLDQGQVSEVALRYVNENGTPVQFSMKANEDKEKQEAKEAAAPKVFMFRTLEFEMLIKLNPLREGGQTANGA